MNPTYEEQTQQLAVAKQLLQDQDRKLAKFESLDLDQVKSDQDRLAKFESLGNPEDVAEAIALKTKFESNDGVTMTAEDQAQLDEYRKLGTIEELTELAEKLEQSEVISTDEAEEIKQDREKLESFQRIGSVEEVDAMVKDYSEMKMKHESVRLASKYNIDTDTAESILQKSESVAHAESVIELLVPAHENRQNTDLTPKHESARVVHGQQSRNANNVNISQLQASLKNL